MYMGGIDISKYEEMQDVIDEIGMNRGGGSRRDPPKMKRDDARERHQKKSKPRQERPNWTELSE